MATHFLFLLTVLTTCYNRHEVFDLFLRSIPKDCYLVCVGDEGKNHDTFHYHKIQLGLNGEYVVHQNQPLGAKWNHGLEIAKQQDFEYLVITGSDDIFCPALWDYYRKLDVHYAGILDIYFLDKPTGRVKYNPGFQNNRIGEPHGAGRAIHRMVLDYAKWKLWDDKLNIGLDASMTTTLKRFYLTSEFIKLRDKGFVAVDVKTTENLHKIDEYSGRWLNDKERKWVLNRIGWTTAV